MSSVPIGDAVPTAFVMMAAFAVEVAVFALIGMF